MSLPKTVSAQAVEARQSFLKIVDNHYRSAYEGVEHANMDGFTAQAWKMLLNPAVQNAFDLSKEPEKLKEQYGKDAFGQSALLARRLVESGSRFVTAAEKVEFLADGNGEFAQAIDLTFDGSGNGLGGSSMSANLRSNCAAASGLEWLNVSVACTSPA